MNILIGAVWHVPNNIMFKLPIIRSVGGRPAK